MSEITKGSSVPRDLAEYVLSSGKLKRSSHGSTSKCSVTNVKLSDIAGAVTTVIDGDDVVFDEEGDGSIDTSFTWSNITSRYKKRPDEYEGLNLYRYVVYHWKSGDTMTIPQFFGYPGRCSWPLREDYSQWMLTFFKPWRNDINELKGGHSTFSAALEEYYLDTDFPDTIRSEIWCHKRKQKPINPDESGLDGDGDLPTPSDETNRHITANDEADHAAQIAEAAAGDAGVVDEEEDADLDDTLFRSLRSGVPDNYDWSNHYDAAKVNSLNEHSKKYYADKNSAIINNVHAQKV